MLHTNVPGHPDFNVYAKCNFVLVLPSASSGPLLEPLGTVPLSCTREAPPAVHIVVHSRPRLKEGNSCRVLGQPACMAAGNGHAGLSNWDSNSGTDLTVSSREPSGSCSAGSSSLFGLSNPISPPAAPEHSPQACPSCLLLGSSMHCSACTAQ